MKILFLTSGPHVPSSRFRVLQWLPRLRAAGHVCVVAHSRPDKYSHYPSIGFRLSQRVRRANRWLDLARTRWGRFDVVFVERELFNDPTWEFEQRFRDIARRLVLDVDDGIFLNWPDKFPRLAAMADCVIAGSDLLAEECRKHNQNIVVVPTSVDVEQYPMKRHERRTKPVIGWTGTSSNIGYLERIHQPLSVVATRREFSLAVIADEGARGLLPRIEGAASSLIPWNEPTERDDLLSFDMGVMPLPEEPWARFKCGLKLLQYMAAGLPAVASPVGVNPQILAQGETGFLVETNDQWVEALDRLLHDDRLRADLGAAGRHVVAERYSLTANWERWLGAVTG